MTVKTHGNVTLRSKGSKEEEAEGLVTVFRHVKGCYEGMRRNIWCSWPQSIGREVTASQAL